jgi:hypothetical protein
MKICVKCSNEFEKGLGKRCHRCVNDYKNEWQRKKKNKRCEFCNQEFNEVTISKECSLKCKLLNRKKEINGCWEWQGKISKNGYGYIQHKKKHMLTHRTSYETFIENIPFGLCVCHKCDNKKCINPEHLFLGTHKDNIQDAKEKGRLPDQRGRKHSEETLKKLKLRRRPDKRGEKHHLCKLTEKDVKEIRELLKLNFKQKEIGCRYGVDQSVISQIKHKKSWAHI